MGIRAARFEKKAKALSGLRRNLSFLRALMFLCIPLPAGASIALSVPLWWGLAAAILPGAGFMALLIRHARTTKLQAAADSLHLSSLDRQQRIQRKFSERAVNEIPADHNYALDLHIDGPFSLMALVDFTRTTGGRRSLFQLLTSQPDQEALDPIEWNARRLAVKELGRSRVFCTRIERSKSSPVESVEIPPSIPYIPLLRFLSIPALLLPPVTVVTWILAESHPALSYYLLTVPLQFLLFLIVHFLLKKSAELWLPFVNHADHCAALLKKISFPFRADKLGHFRPSPEHPGKLWNRLARLTGLWNTRRNPLLHVLAGVFLLYEVHIVLALHRLLAGRRDMENALPRLYSFEALLSLGMFEADAPDTVEPDRLTTSDAVIHCRKLAHPLLAAGVPNDLQLSLKDQSVGVISGSNMSGKSTFLRAVGANLVLAMSGGRVFAERLEFFPVRLFASMTVRDDLSESVSLFLAEVRRIRRLFDTVHMSGPPVLFLLDEMLRGTNTVDRVRAVRSIIRGLKGEHALGLVATHDPEVMALSTEVQGIFSGHFQETVTASGMTFDYTLRSGPASGGNAIRILEMHGIPIQ